MSAPIFGHGPLRARRSGAKFMGDVIGRVDDTVGLSKLVVLGADALGPFAAEFAYDGHTLGPSVSVELVPSGQRWQRVCLDSLPAHELDVTTAESLIESHRASLAADFAIEVEATLGVMRPAASLRAQRSSDQDADFAIADIVTRTESTCLALRAAVATSGAGRCARISAALLRVRDLAGALDALALDLAVWAEDTSSIVAPARALSVRAAYSLPADWLRETVALSIFSR